MEQTGLPSGEAVSRGAHLPKPRKKKEIPEPCGKGTSGKKLENQERIGKFVSSKGICHLERGSLRIATRREGGVGLRSKSGGPGSMWIFYLGGGSREGGKCNRQEGDKK